MMKLFTLRLNCNLQVNYNTIQSKIITAFFPMPVIFLQTFRFTSITTYTPSQELARVSEGAATACEKEDDVDNSDDFLCVY